MSVETQAASSPAEVADPFNGEQPTMAEFEQYRQSGELPARFKPTADPAPADTLEETGKTEDPDDPEPAPDSETEKQELPPKAKPHEKRIKQLLAETNELKRQLAEKQDGKPESSPVATERTKPTADDKDKDGHPKYATYEDFVEDLADWKAEQRLESARREQAKQDAQKALQSKLDEARTRYDDADEAIFPAAKAVNEAKIPLAVKEVFAQSDVFIDLCYVVGSDPDELNSFIALAQSNPRAAIGKVFEYERGIKEELSRPRDDKGQFVAPEPKKTTAPKPPSPVGGTSSRAFDVSDDSLSNEEWMRQRNKQLGKG